jgi:hypothetical protein
MYPSIGGPDRGVGAATTTVAALGGAVLLIACTGFETTTVPEYEPVTAASGGSPGGGGSTGSGAAMDDAGLTAGAAGSNMVTPDAGGEGGSGMEVAPPEAPATLSETGLFSGRDADGELILSEGIVEFQPRYALWSDGAEKHRYVYLPTGAQIDTSDPDHWVVPVGTKLWKSFVAGGQLVETRLIERTGDGEFLFATYFWETADATDAVKMEYRNLLLNAAGTSHDIPNGMMCEACHARLTDRALGFSALQLNHDLGGLNLETLLAEGWLTDPVSLDIQMPGDDPLTQDALGYLHANCGNCHNDSPGLLVESVPEPQMLLRVSVNDQTLEDTGTYRTAINQLTTASDELGIDYRIVGGNDADSAVPFRMTMRMIEDQMPPIGTEIIDPEGLALIESWIQSLPPPTP